MGKNDHIFIHILVKVGFVRDSITHNSCHNRRRHQMINSFIILGRLRSYSVISKSKVITFIFVIAFTFMQPHPLTLINLALHHFSLEHTLELFNFVFCIFRHDSFLFLFWLAMHNNNRQQADYYVGRQHHEHKGCKHAAYPSSGENICYVIGESHAHSDEEEERHLVDVM